MHQVSIEQATAHSADVFSDALRGEEIIITDHDVAVLKVMPFGRRMNTMRMPGKAVGMISYIAEDFDATPPGFEEYL